MLQRARSFLDALTPGAPTCYYDEFVRMTTEYELLLRQARLMIRCSDLTTLGLNTDKLNLQDKVNIDELTGIYNRRFLEENLRRYHNLLSRSQGRIGLLMLDLDFFKNYNDTYGHTAGDHCLRAVANILRNTVNRADDFVARYGGEEFIVVLSGVHKEGALLMAQRILENVQALNITHENSCAAPCVTVSIGVMSAPASHGHSPEQYIECADAALYESKRSGRNCVTYREFQEHV